MKIRNYLVMSMCLIGLSACGSKESPSSIPYDAPDGTVVNTFVLPPIPDEDEVDATLLGVDVNDNGIRDEIERKIIIDLADDKNAHALTAVALQQAHGYQGVMIDSGRNFEPLQSVKCRYYWMEQREKYNLNEANPHLESRKAFKSVKSLQLKDLSLNTPERMRKWFEWWKNMDGTQNTTPDGPRNSNVCTHDVKKYVEMDYNE